MAEGIVQRWAVVQTVMHLRFFFKTDELLEQFSDSPSLKYVRIRWE